MKHSMILIASLAGLLASAPLLADHRYREGRHQDNDYSQHAAGHHASANRFGHHRGLEHQHQGRHQYRHKRVYRDAHRGGYYRKHNDYRSDYRHAYRNYGQRPVYGSGFGFNLWSFQPLSPHSGISFHYHHNNQRCYSRH